MTRFAATSIALALVLAAACSQTSGDRAGGSPEPVGRDLESGMPSPSIADEMEPTEPEAGTETEEEPPRFEGGVFRIGTQLRNVLIGRNWKPGCPVAIHDLRLVRVSYWNFRGTVRTGPLVLHERVAEDVLWVFRQMFRAGFRIQEIKLAAKDRPLTPKDYWNRTRRSVTASFNCRPATGSTSLSQHSYGWAIDINPLQNPYVRNDGTTLRHIAQPFRDRSLHLQGDDPRGRRRGPFVRGDRLGVGRPLAHPEGLHALLAHGSVMDPLTCGFFSAPVTFPAYLGATAGARSGRSARQRAGGNDSSTVFSPGGRIADPAILGLILREGLGHTPQMGVEYLPLIESLMKVDAPIVLFGGFAEDAMLGGAIRRHHDDVDVFRSDHPQRHCPQISPLTSIG